MKLAICMTYDDHFEPMFRHLISNLADVNDNIDFRINKIRTEDEDRKFGSKSWYENLSNKMTFLQHNMSSAQEGQILCVSDSDIQFFKPKDLIERSISMADSDIEYLGQREGGTADENLGGDFNGGFFLVKKNDKTSEFVNRVCSTDISKYRLADQEVINHQIRSLGIKAKFLEARKYVHGCCIQYEDYVGPSNSENIVMHHATCSGGIKEKMDQMNAVRMKMNFPAIDWGSYV